MSGQSRALAHRPALGEGKAPLHGGSLLPRAMLPGSREPDPTGKRAQLLGNHEALARAATSRLLPQFPRPPPSSSGCCRSSTTGARPRAGPGRTSGRCRGSGRSGSGAAKEGGGRGQAYGRGRPYVLEAALLELLHRRVLRRLLQPLGAVGRADVQPQHLAREDLLLLHEHRAAAARPAPAARAVKVTGAGPGRPRARSLAAAAPPRLPSADRPSLAAGPAVASLPPPGRRGRAVSAATEVRHTARARSMPGDVVLQLSWPTRRRAGSASQGAPGTCRDL